MDGGTLEYIFETDEQDVPKTVSKEKAAEIAADFMTTFDHRSKQVTSRRSRTRIYSSGFVVHESKIAI